MDDEQAFKALELFGDPTEGEVRLPSRPESAATARRLTSCVVLRQWSLSPQTAEFAVLLVSELVGNAVRHTGARVFGLRMVRRRGWIRIEVRDPAGSAVPHAGARDGRQRPGPLPGRQAVRPVGRGPAAARQGHLVRDAHRRPLTGARPLGSSGRIRRSLRFAVVGRCGGF
ncbi:ATP-binding protein [Streptomyces globisporus]|uniref:ATP-binding protein n=1 Tax=Streptomyces globisporus TaxID=1908 RepID=A0A927BLM6_STRGL|nr:ATP-binding protein [Streptomyces globisporus]